MDEKLYSALVEKTNEWADGVNNAEPGTDRRALIFSTAFVIGFWMDRYFKSNNMKGKKYKEVPVEEAMKQLDETFNIKNFEKTEGQSYRIEREYYIHESDFKQVDAMTKLFEFFQGVVVVDEHEDLLCEIPIQDCPEGYMMFRLA